MDSVKDILSQLKTNIPQEKKKDSQQELFDVNLLQTNPKKIFGDNTTYSFV